MDPDADQAGTTRVAVDALDVYSAHDVLTTLRAAIALPGDVQVDLRQASGMHTAALQILLAAARTVRAEGRRFDCIHVSPEISQTLRLTGLAGILLADGEPGKDVS
jgi:anti-anti-sigma factor